MHWNPSSGRSSRPDASPRCACCWHAELVGGARTRGRAGHDVDILLWHATEAASRGGTARDYVIHDLARGVLVPGDDGGWKTNGGLQHRGDASGRLLRADEGFQCIFRRRHSRREGGTYRYKTKTVAFISIATPCRAPRVVALAAKKNPLHPSRV